MNRPHPGGLNFGLKKNGLRRFSQTEPYLIHRYGPLIALWTMLFERQYRFCRVAEKRCFKNVLVSLTVVSTVHTDVLNEDISNVLRNKSSNNDKMIKSATYSGINYKCVMILICMGRTADFAETT